MTTRTIYRRQIGEDIVIQVIDDTASSGNAGSVTAKMKGPLAAGTWELAGDEADVLAFTTAYRAASGTPGDDDYLAKGYDFTALAAAVNAATLSPGTYLFDYTDTHAGEFTSDPVWVSLKRSASQ